MIENNIVNAFLIIVIILFLLGLVVPLILIKKRGKDPHGMHDGFSILSKLTFLSISLWIIYILLRILFNEVWGNFWTFNLLSFDFIIITGFVIITLGFVFEILGMITLGINFRIELPKEETELVTSGIYRIMRNPIVFGIFLLVIGSFLMIPDIFTLIALIFNIVTFNSKAKDEERFLINRFGKLYEDYIGQVGRYFPIRLKTSNRKE
jgi:protein-S-isoprenylcysteine O-methyltransferase Ste14